MIANIKRHDFGRTESTAGNSFGGGRLMESIEFNFQ
jgi:hypothetical protein